MSEWTAAVVFISLSGSFGEGRVPTVSVGCLDAVADLDRGTDVEVVL